MTVVTAAMTEVTGAMTEVMTEVTGARTAATVAPDPGCSASPTAPVEHAPSPPRVFEARKCSQREPAIRPYAQAATAERKCSRKLVRALPLAMRPRHSGVVRRRRWARCSFRLPAQVEVTLSRVLVSMQGERLERLA